MKYRLMKWGLIAVCAFGLTGCMSLRTEVSASADVNPDINNQPSPVVVKVYQLTQEDKFKQATFAELYSQPKEILGAELLSVNSGVVAPDEEKTISSPINKRVHYIGVVAGLRQYQQATWKAIIAVNHKRVNHVLGYSIDARLTNAGLSLTPGWLWRKDHEQ